MEPNVVAVDMLVNERKFLVNRKVKKKLKS
jgi:hypothetical protein